MEELTSSLLGLTTALGLVTAAAVFSVWLLRLILPELFCIVFIANLSSVFVGISVSTYATKDCGNRLPAEVMNILFAVGLSMLVSSFVIRGLAEKSSAEEGAAFWVPKMLTLFGVAMDCSLFFLLLRCAAIMADVRRAEFRRLGRQIQTMNCWAPKAQVRFCADLEATAPGACAICLEPLATVVDEDLLAAGLLQLPCRHTFHALCAEPWLQREVTCPLCREPIHDFSRCVHLRTEPARSGVLGRAAEASAEVMEMWRSWVHSGKKLLL